MRGYGLYDMTRGLTIGLAAGVVGLLLWVATRVGTQTDKRYWAAMAIVAGAGLVLALAHVLGGWTSGLRLRLSPATFVLAFVPVLICAGWILVATQPGHGWQEGHLTGWDHSAGLTGLVHDLGLWHGVLAFGLGLVFGFSLDSVPAPVAAGPEPIGRRGPAADEPVSAERRSVDRQPGAPIDERELVGQRRTERPYSGD
jgi:hypothetical protein